jgi:hypothetical protein
MTMTKKLITGLAAVAAGVVLTVAVGLATPSLARDVIGGTGSMIPVAASFGCSSSVVPVRSGLALG